MREKSKGNRKGNQIIRKGRGGGKQREQEKEMRKRENKKTNVQ